MNRKKIKLSTPEMVADFINVCSKYKYDINLYDGKNVINAKSITQGKEIEVEIITKDKSAYASFIEDMFIEDMRKFEV